MIANAWNQPRVGRPRKPQPVSAGCGAGAQDDMKAVLGGRSMRAGPRPARSPLQAARTADEKASCRSTDCNSAVTATAQNKPQQEPT